MFCRNCGNMIADNARCCSSCGAVVNESENQQFYQAASTYVPTHHPIPKCNYCGNIEEWKIEPLFRPMDFIIGIILLIFGIVPGIIYLGVVGLIRSNKDHRAKICKKCGAKNMFTNLY